MLEIRKNISNFIANKRKQLMSLYFAMNLFVTRAFAMDFFNSGVDALEKIVYAIGGGFIAWGAINLAEGYGSDNPGAKSQGIKQMMAGGGILLIGNVLVPQLSGLF